MGWRLRLDCDAQLGRNDNRRLGTNYHRGVVRVGANIARRDTHVRDLEALGAVHVQPGVHDAVLASGLHGTRP